MSILADDVAVIFADTLITVPVVFGTQSTRGLLTWEETVGKDDSGFDALVRRRTLTVPTGSLTNPTAGASITVDGNVYVIHDVQKHQSALVQKLFLAS